MTPAEPGGLFLSTPHGRSFCMRYPGSSGLCALLVAPFAEEMNRTRRMWTLLAHALARRGVAVLVPDLHGTGESDGDFADARWEYWLEDIGAAQQQAFADGAKRIALVGVRLGALLALDFLRRAAAVGKHESLPAGAPAVTHVVLWQPVVSGEQFMNQFLRLKLAAGIRQAGGPQRTSATLRAQLAAGESLEVAGYELTFELVSAIDALSLVALASEKLPPVAWFEVSTSDPPALTPVGVRTVDALRRANTRVEARAVRGEAFWSLQEITVAPELVAATVELLAPIAVAPSSAKPASLHS